MTNDNIIMLIAEALRGAGLFVVTRVVPTLSAYSEQGGYYLGTLTLTDDRINLDWEKPYDIGDPAFNPQELIDEFIWRNTHREEILRRSRHCVRTQMAAIIAEFAARKDRGV